MTLNEAIKHCIEVAENNDELVKNVSPVLLQIAKSDMNTYKADCEQCAADHRQLAEWLQELKEARKLLKLAVKEAPTTSFCYLCKFKDYDNNECNHTDKCFVWRYAEELKNYLNE